MDQQKRNVAIAVVAVVIIAFAGYRVLTARSGGAMKFPDEFTAAGICLNCKQETTITFHPGEKPPYHCEGCGEDAVYPWWFCNDCKYRFIPELIRKPGQPPRPTPYPVCTHCGCADVSGWDPDNPYQVPQGDAPLPKWP